VYAILVAAAWPGESTRGWFLPAVVAGAVALVAGPRAGSWQLAAWGVSAIGEGAKRLFHRPRPLLGRFIPLGGTARGSSFPSTHVSNYTATFGFACWILWRKRSRIALPASAIALSLIGLIGPSRVLTGDHRWSDVGGGYAMGLLYLATMIGFAKRDRLLTRPAMMAPDAAETGAADPIRPFAATQGDNRDVAMGVIQSNWLAPLQ
jgi:membrane-associated phospholipid phosphatase